MRENCAFCLATPVTIEDAIPSWVSRRLIKRGQRTRNFKIEDVLAADATPTISVGQKVKAAAPLVCATCNNGWMSQLESSVIPWFGPMLEGANIALKPSRQQQLATWACKTAFMLALVDSERDGVGQDHRSYLCKYKEPPPGVVVSLASYSGQFSGTQYDIKSASVSSADGQTNESPTEILTFSIGKVLFQVLAPAFGMTVHPAFDLPVPVRNRALQICPPSSFTLVWPPSQSVDDETFFVFSRGDHHPLQSILKSEKHRT
jgi:hypothetical protein